MKTTALALALVAVHYSFASAEAVWQKVQKEDELTGKKMDGVVIVDDPAKDRDAAYLVLEFGNPLKVMFAGGSNIRLLPDNLGRDRSAAITYRAKGSEMRNAKVDVSTNFKEATFRDLTAVQVEELLSGDSLILQFDKSGKRHTFDMSGTAGKELRDYVKERLKVAP
jgi:hypothetical protein